MLVWAADFGRRYAAGPLRAGCVPVFCWGRLAGSARQVASGSHPVWLRRIPSTASRAQLRAAARVEIGCDLATRPRPPRRNAIPQGPQRPRRARPRRRYHRPDRAQAGPRRPDQRIPQNGLASAKRQVSGYARALAQHSSRRRLIWLTSQAASQSGSGARPGLRFRR
jgi:hypothetical protein